MARNVAGAEELSPESQLIAAWRRTLPCIDALMRGEGRYALRDLFLFFKAPGVWRARVKALDKDNAMPVILFADGPSFAVALKAAERAVKAARWTNDRYPGKQWAR